MIEDLAKCNYKAPSEASGSSSRLKGSGVIELNRMTSIEAKLDALMNKIGNNERRMQTALEVGTIDERERRKSVEEGSNHASPYQFKEAQYPMPIGATLSSPTSTCPLTTHQHSEVLGLTSFSQLP